MLEWLKSAWAKWKVQVSMVGGVIIVATAYGTCSYDPQVVSEADIAPVEVEVVEKTLVSEIAAGNTEVENTTTTTNVENGGTTTETTTETTE